MDGRGRLAEPLTRRPVSYGGPLPRPAAISSREAPFYPDTAYDDELPRQRQARGRRGSRTTAPSFLQAADLRQAFLDRFAPGGRRLYRAASVATSYLPRGAGVAVSALIILGSGAYGAVKGEHVPAVVEYLRDTRDAAANAAGFRVATVAVRGRNQLADEEILAAAGVTENRSLLFLDVEAVREGLEAVPWIAQASVRKFYPDHLDITLEERAAFAYWQQSGKLSVISADGTVLGPVGQRRLAQLPLVVGPGAAARAREFLEIVDRYPLLRDQLRAAVLVAERRWNLKLNSGLDIRLPETGVAEALETVAALDRDKKILTRDLTAIDMRLPGRVTVRLSDEAAQAREQVGKDKKKKKGGDA